jgi:hypothetical protein
MGIVYAVDLKQPDKALAVWNQYLKYDPNSATAVQIKGMMQKLGSGSTPTMK